MKEPARVKELRKEIKEIECRIKLNQQTINSYNKLIKEILEKENKI